jgi:hypothetical protein
MSNTSSAGKPINAPYAVIVHPCPPGHPEHAPLPLSLEASHFLPMPPKSGRQKKARIPSSPYLIIGFDTEFQTPDSAVTQDDIKAGKAKYEVLSYQFHAEGPDGASWEGISCPERGERMSLGEFLTFAIAEGVRQGRLTQCPLRIYLVGHFTRADVPAFQGFQDLRLLINNIRNTFISIDSALRVAIDFDTGEKVELQIVLRDTMLLAPAQSKSLAAIGDLVGEPKLSLDPDPKREQFLKENMSVLRRENWELFRRYALTDARICVAYAKKVIAEYEAITGVRKMPSTLSSIGVDLVLKVWKDNLKIDPLRVLGKEEISESKFDRKLRYFVPDTKRTWLATTHYHAPLATEAYHGGRNEQFWFGPGYEADWNDYDLASAYPTAMSLIGLPDWDNPKVSVDLADYTPTTLGYVHADFRFPEDVRYPTIPVRTNNGLIFPLSGNSHFSAPELCVARDLGAEITIKHGVIYPTDETVRPFGQFVQHCIEKRRTHTKGSLEELFWKEITNSTYGKTAQGLKEKRVYDMRAEGTKPLPESRITNPFYAAFITSYVRALLGEIMNALPADKMVFSCTTDGFLTDASDDDIAKAQKGKLGLLFGKARGKITGESKVLEIKHSIRQPLGWRTRGQATLKPGNGANSLVLAKAGIRAPRSMESTDQQNGFITGLFFERSPSSRMTMDFFTSVKDMVLWNTDLVTKEIEKRLNMEFDWKRAPVGIAMSASHQHIAFSTRPWRSVSEFTQVRQVWEEMTQKQVLCIKTHEDYNVLAAHVLNATSLDPKARIYLRKEGGDLKRLRQQLCIAWSRAAAGFTAKDWSFSRPGFAEILRAHGIPCKVSDVENAEKKPTFIPHQCPPTAEVQSALRSLKASFPSLKTELFLPIQWNKPLLPLQGEECPFIAKLG